MFKRSFKFTYGNEIIYTSTFQTFLNCRKDIFILYTNKCFCDINIYTHKIIYYSVEVSRKD